MAALDLTVRDEPAIILCNPIPRSAIEELEQWLQERMPPGWKVTCLFKLYGEHHQFTGYELHLGFDVFTIGAKGECEPPPGWTVRHIPGAYCDDVAVTAPDRTEATLTYILLA